MKKYSFVLLLMVFVGSSIFFSADAVNKIDLDTASQKILAKSVSILSSSNTLKTLENQLNDAYGSAQGAGKALNMNDKLREMMKNPFLDEATKDKLRGLLMDDETKMGLIKASQFSTLELKHTIDALQTGLEAQKNGMRLTAAGQLIALEKLTLARNISVHQAKNSLTDYQTAQSQYKLGRLSKLNLMKAELAWRKAEAGQMKQSRALNVAWMGFYRLMGEPVQTTAKEISIEAMAVPSQLKPVETYLADAMKNRSEMLSANDSVAVKDKEFKLTQTVYGWNKDTDYAQGELNYKTALNGLTTSTLQVQSDIKSGYSQLLSAQSSWQNAKATLAISKKKYSDAQLNFKNGSISTSGLDKTLIQLEQSTLQEISARLDFWLAWYKMELASGVGPGTTSGTGGLQ